jgi:hypothetical protein
MGPPAFAGCCPNHTPPPVYGQNKMRSRTNEDTKKKRLHLAAKLLTAKDVLNSMDAETPRARSESQTAGDKESRYRECWWRIAEGAVFEEAVLAQPQTAALLRRLMEERGLKVE